MKKTSKRFWFLNAIILSSLFGAAARANTTTAASCNASDVQTAINAAQNGDTVIIPNGSCSWSVAVTLTKQITLQGQTVGGVTITDTNPNPNSAGLTANLLNVIIGGNFHTTIANLRFMPGTGTGNYININGTGLVPLMHDMYFNVPNAQLFQAVQWWVVGGVIWNTTFESTDTVYPGSDSGCLVVKSSLPWDTPSTMGTLDTNGDKNLYIEDSTFNNVGQCPDVDENGRVVLRHSQIIGSAGLTHGTTSTYGGRFIEFYNDTFSYPDPTRNLNRYFWWRAGTGVVTNNSIQWINGSKYPNKPSFTFAVENAQRAGAHGCLTGYMGFHQPGSGASGSQQSPTNLHSGQSPAEPYQISDPVYIWNNSGTGSGVPHIGLNDGSPQDCFNINPLTGVYYTTSDFFVLNRDYFVDSRAKPGWQPYTYPHPLRNAVGGGATKPVAPTGLAAIVQ